MLELLEDRLRLEKAKHSIELEMSRLRKGAAATARSVVPAAGSEEATMGATPARAQEPSAKEAKIKPSEEPTQEYRWRWRSEPTATLADREAEVQRLRMELSRCQPQVEPQPEGAEKARDWWWGWQSDQSSWDSRPSRSSWDPQPSPPLPLPRPTQQWTEQVSAIASTPRPCPAPLESRLGQLHQPEAQSATSGGLGTP